eukprot:Gregarina_sp_Poly_1__4961@NODE_262_length_10455_cov_153_948017_g229_i0_p2_GENE_NODE_262_length_10455_cov_153_948017_g229_i0NODE_262_length_10455_cov_153_948017_g229_i0_p2_ORF_typecomplete_len934_score195_28KH_1/PF00013_29/1_8e02KH_1/PF00013_29/0_99KH_1/PF00013_29/5_5e02KH_1/PF00013_29/48KH_1/PF00013_29/6_1KH_1/PF00013_29/5_9e11SLS/PF14611_6/5_8e02SLS/PF14611_6/1_7e02SLS/PF14611_6/11SLS/PF14611_6/0_00014SLS/PF14611_6/1_1SLS/PF14611_6/2_1e03KH_4/PF13083_6/6_3e02KH_4/PF13083_6/0_048Pox_Rap94/PF0329
MSGFFTTIAAIKDRVIAAVLPETSQPVVPQLSSKRPPNKKIAGNKKKKTTKKKKAMKPKESGDAESQDSLSDANVPTAAELPCQSAEESAIVDEDENVSGEHDDPHSDKEPSEDLEEAGASHLTAAELAKKERNRRKSQKAKEKAKIKKALLATSVVRTLADDSLEPERAALYETLVTEFKALPVLRKSDVRMEYDSTQKILDAFAARIEAVCKEMEKKTPKPEIRNMTSQALKAQIQDIEFSPDRDENAFVKKVDQLHIVISFENQRAWITKVQGLKDQVEAQKKANDQLMEAAKEQEARERILLRLKALKEASDPGCDVEALTDGLLECLQYDLQPEQQSAIYQPYNLLRRIERRFQVVIEAAARSSVDVSRRGSRIVNVWGLKEDVEKTIKFLNEADLSGKQRRQYERRYMGAIIGRAGTGLALLEDLGQAFVLIDGTHDVVVFGSAEGAKAIFEQIERSKSETAEVQAAAELPLASIVARAISSLHRAALQSLESSLKCRLVVVSNPTDGSEPRLIIRARADLLEAAKAKVRADIVDSYIAVSFPAPSRAVNRLLVPPKNVSETAQSRLLHEEFRLLRETLALFVDRYGTRSGPDEPQDDSDSGMTIVCHKVDLDVVQTRVADLIDRASYSTTRIPIEREQLRKFTPENRALIEASSKCQVSVSSNQTGAFLNLLGSEEAIDSAKKVVAEILQREGRLETIEIDEAEVINALLRDRAARLRALETEHNVSISVYRDSHTCKVVGDEVSIAACGDAIRAMCEERKNRRAQTETLSMEIESRKIPQLIGRAGNTINEIRSTSEVDSIHIPSREESADLDSPVTITISGLKKNVEVAQKMIERILAIRSTPAGAESGEPQDDSVGENPYTRQPRGRGRGRAIRERSAQQVPRLVRQASNSENYDENFPCLPASAAERLTPQPREHAETEDAD